MFWGILLIVAGFSLFQWVGNNLKKPFLEKPLILNDEGRVLALTILFLLFYVAGFLILWLSNKPIALIIFISLCLLWLLGYHKKTQR